MSTGMAKPCPDAMIRGENAAGFVSDDSFIAGFSHLHDSGTLMLGVLQVSKSTC